MDFVLDYPQTPLEYDLIMKLLTSLRIKVVNQNNHCLQLMKNIYVQKQAGRVWNQYLVQGLFNIGFNQSDIDKCVFTELTSFFFCVDYGCILIISSKYVGRSIADLKYSKTIKCNFYLEDCRDI